MYWAYHITTTTMFRKCEHMPIGYILSDRNERRDKHLLSHT